MSVYSPRNHLTSNLRVTSNQVTSGGEGCRGSADISKPDIIDVKISWTNI